LKPRNSSSFGAFFTVAGLFAFEKKVVSGPLRNEI